MTTEIINLNRLVQSKANVRQTGQTIGIEQLMASIAAHGLRQNLNVRATTGGRFEVVAGGRRLIALKKLARAGTIAADAPIPCLVLADDDNATEISLAENQMRQEMHPDDQCAAFESLIGDGMPLEDIAARFGVTPAVVRQRLKLAAVSSKLRALHRQGKATLAQMMALTLSDDHAAQELAFGDGNNPYAIRQALTQGTLPLNARLVQFVGVEAYRQAGGAIVDDLFNPEEGFVADLPLLRALAEAKLATMAEAVSAEGWSWVQPCLRRDHETPYRRLYGEPQEGGGVSYSLEQLAHAGAMVTVGFDGEIDIERGLVRPQDARKLAQAEGGEDGTAKVRPDYPAALMTDLTAHKTAALRLALAQNSRVALAAMVHALVTASQNPYSPMSALQVSTKSRDLTALVADTDDCTAHAAMAAELDHWNDRIPAEPGALWEWLLRQDNDTLLSVQAIFAAVSLDAVSGRAYGFSIRHADQLAAALNLDMTQHWHPSALTLGRVSKSALATALTEAGEPALAADIGVMTKAAAVAKAVPTLAAAHWLPPVLRTVVAANDNTPAEAQEATAEAA